jgi:hypothetical protein
VLRELECRRGVRIWQVVATVASEPQPCPVAASWLDEGCRLAGVDTVVGNHNLGMGLLLAHAGPFSPCCSFVCARRRSLRGREVPDHPPRLQRFRRSHRLRGRRPVGVAEALADVGAPVDEDALDDLADALDVL